MHVVEGGDVIAIGMTGSTIRPGRDQAACGFGIGRTGHVIDSHTPGQWRTCIASSVSASTFGTFAETTAS